MQYIGTTKTNNLMQLFLKKKLKAANYLITFQKKHLITLENTVGLPLSKKVKKTLNKLTLTK